jgi:hypothetical protein
MGTLQRMKEDLQRLEKLSALGDKEAQAEIARDRARRGLEPQHCDHRWEISGVGGKPGVPWTVVQRYWRCSRCGWTATETMY